MSKLYEARAFAQKLAERETDPEARAHLWLLILATNPTVTSYSATRPTPTQEQCAEWWSTPHPGIPGEPFYCPALRVAHAAGFATGAAAPPSVSPQE